MEVIDCQIHVPHDVPELLPRASPEDCDRLALRITTAVLDAVGVDGALVNWTPRFNALAVEAHPERFRSMLVFEPHRADLRRILRQTFPAFPDNLVLPFHDAEDLGRIVADAAQRAALASLRLEVGWQVTPTWRGLAELFAKGAYDPIFEVARVTGLPVCMWLAGALAALPRIAEAWPDVTLVIDHAGLVPAFAPESDPEAEVKALLGLARFPNIVVKASGLIGRSTRPYPHPDVQQLVRAILDAYGPDRVMWGSDYTMHPQVSYAAALRYLLDFDVLAEAERPGFFGANLRRVFKWPAAR